MELERKPGHLDEALRHQPVDPHGVDVAEGSDEIGVDQELGGHDKRVGVRPHVRSRTCSVERRYRHQVVSTWTRAQLDKIGAADELEIQSRRKDGTLRPPVTVWVARVGDDLYLRPVKGRERAGSVARRSAKRAASPPGASPRT